jgi:hypothetical protein
MDDLKTFLKRWYKYARAGKILAVSEGDEKKAKWFSEQMDYIESQWVELRKQENEDEMVRRQAALPCGR